MTRPMKKNNLRTKNPRKGQSYQQKVNSFAIYIAFLLLLLLLFLLFTGKGQPLRKTRTAKPKPKIMTDDGPSEKELFRCLYCYKDFAKRNYLLNHVHKNKKCSAKKMELGHHYTNSNWWRKDDRKHVCEYAHCNGTYSTPRSLWTHYNKDHGLKKSDEEFQREIRDTGVCNRKPIRKKSSQSQPKGRNLTLFFMNIAISISFIPLTFLQLPIDKPQLRNQRKQLLLLLLQHPKLVRIH